MDWVFDGRINSICRGMLHRLELVLIAVAVLAAAAYLTYRLLVKRSRGS